MSELKMSDVFVSESGKFVVGNVNREVYQDIDHNMIDIVGKFETTKHAEYASHAIKNHDRLVEENQRLTAIATKHATVNDERYELLEKQKSDIEKMLDQLFKHEKVDGWLVCKMNDMLDDVNHQLEKSRIEAEKGDGICN